MTIVFASSRLIVNTQFNCTYLITQEINAMNDILEDYILSSTSMRKSVRTIGPQTENARLATVAW